MSDDVKPKKVELESFTNNIKVGATESKIIVEIDRKKPDKGENSELVASANGEIAGTSNVILVKLYEPGRKINKK